MSRHRDKLRAYLFDVTRDLALRGAFRHYQGQPPETILRSETLAVLVEVEEDLRAVLAEIGVGVVHGILDAAKGFFAKMLSGGVKKG